MLYASESREGALAERRFHLFQGQPFPPSRVRYEMFELWVSLGAVMRFADLEALVEVGLRVAGYGRLSYLEREQGVPAIAGGRRGPARSSGRTGCGFRAARDATQSNVIVFCEQPTVVDKRVVRHHGPVDFAEG